MALELKASEKSKVSELQNFFLEKIAGAGGVALLVYPENWEEIKVYLEMLAFEELDEDRILQGVSNET